MYWLVPLLNSLRVTAISPGVGLAGTLGAPERPLLENSRSSVSSGSCSVKVTLAMPAGLRWRVPAKMTSCMRPPRRDLADCSPSTQFTASQILDLPQPLGPTTAASPFPANFKCSRVQNDLKPTRSICLSLSMCRLPPKIRARSAPPAGSEASGQRMAERV